MLLASRTSANGLSLESMTILSSVALRMPVSVVGLSRVEVDFVFCSNATRKGLSLTGQGCEGRLGRTRGRSRASDEWTLGVGAE